MLQECYRILRIGGRIRISTPDLARYVQMYADSDADLSKVTEYLFNDWITPGFYAAKNYRPIKNSASNVFAINDVFRNYERQPVLDFATLKNALEHSGFRI